MTRQTARHGKKSRAPDLSPAVLLRPRLDGLWGNPVWPGRSNDDLRADLDVVVRGIPPATFLGTMLKAYAAAPAPAQTRLDQIVPAWLRERGYSAALRDGIVRGMFTGADHELALAWLQAAGDEIHALLHPQEPDTFFGAHFYGDDSQATLVLLWYRDRRRAQVQGFNFLIDYNPPWDGSVKDIIAFPRRDPRSAIRDFVEIWYRRDDSPGLRLAPISAVEAKRRILEALICNDRQSIRLPADLIANQTSFIRHVLPLPDGPDTPPFTADDFIALAQTGKRPEEIMRFEQQVGRRVRMEDGTEVFIMGGGLDEDEWTEKEGD